MRRSNRASAIAFGALMALVSFGTALAAQRPANDTSELRDSLEAVREQMEDDLYSAIQTLDRLATQSIARRAAGPLDPDERALHRELFLLRTRGHLQLLDNERVEESLTELLRVDPFFTGPLAPRERELLESIRLREGGFLEVSSPDLDASILVDGLTIDRNAGGAARLTLLAGSYEVRLAKDGYRPDVRRIAITPDTVVTLNDLALGLRVPPVAFLSDTENVEVLIGNSVVGRTTKLSMLRRALRPPVIAALTQAATSSGLDPDQVAVFLLPDPPVDASMSLVFRRSCYVDMSRAIAVTIGSLQQLGPEQPVLWFGEASIVRMQTDVSALNVTSDPSGADVYVDGELVGTTPFERPVCAGRYDIWVRHRIGSQRMTATVGRDKPEAITVTLRPSLAFLGGVETVEGSLRPSPSLTARLDRILASSVRSLPVKIRPLGAADMNGTSERLAAELVAALDRHEESAVLELLRQGAEHHDASLLLVAVRRPADAAQASPDPVDLLLFWTAHTGVDRVRMPAPDQEIAAVLALLDEPADAESLLQKHDIGVEVADTMLPNVPLMVVRVESDSPAAAALAVGDAVLAVDGSPVNADEFRARLDLKPPGTDVIVRSARNNLPREARLEIRQVPRRPYRLDRRTLFTNALIAKLETASALTDDGTQRQLVDFSRALASIRLGDWRAAANILSRVRDAGGIPGIGTAVVAFHLARCYEALGDAARAVEHYREASRTRNVPLTDDGTDVASVASRRLSTLGPGRE